MIGVVNTISLENIESEIEKLLNEYNIKIDIVLEDIGDFHYTFEIIHPFGDENGHVGRIIMFK